MTVHLSLSNIHIVLRKNKNFRKTNQNKRKAKKEDKHVVSA